MSEVRFKFYGTPDHAPMEWSVLRGHFQKWCVVESYDEWSNYVVNCEVESEQEGWDFISAWFAQFTEGNECVGLRTLGAAP